MWFKSICTWIEDKWMRFEAWVNTWLPGLKVKIISMLGMLGSTAAIAKEYIDGLPGSDLVSAKAVGIVGLVLFTLAFWLRGIGDRVDARNA